MDRVKRVYVEKKEPFAVKAKELRDELKGYLIQPDSILLGRNPREYKYQ